MEQILQTVRELPGVTAAFVFDGNGQLAALQGHSIYDAELVAQVSQSLVKALESVQLQMPDWDAVSAQFQDGMLGLRNLGTGSDGQARVLAVVADAQLGTPFAAVALRVAVQKLKKVLDGSASAGSSSPGAARSSAPGSRPPSQPGLRAVQSQPPVASTGMTWSRLSGSSGSSGIEVADAASSAFLTRCSKELARHLGPMSKIYVKEAVRRVSPSAPFALALARPLVEDLANQIEDLEDRARFRKALEKV